MEYDNIFDELDALNGVKKEKEEEPKQKRSGSKVSGQYGGTTNHKNAMDAFLKEASEFNNTSQKPDVLAIDPPMPVAKKVELPPLGVFNNVGGKP